MRFASLETIQSLIESRIPESTTLEYKSELTLDPDSQRKEFLKDLTGMGNGGGGTIIIGMEEQKDTSIAKCLTPVPDLSVIGRVENLVIDAVRPPLIWSHAAFQKEGGWVIVVDVERSPLGPYMVQSHGDHRFHKRAGRNVHRMSEQEVRDAYSLALRAIERRDQVWKRHLLPLRFESGPVCISFSALPEEPLNEIIDTRKIEPLRFVPPESIAAYVNQTSLVKVPFHLRRWADGLMAEVPKEDSHTWLNLRIHRDGAIGLAQEVGSGASFDTMWRTLNAFLCYVAWIWNDFSLQNSVEMEIAIFGVGPAQPRTNMLSAGPPGLVQPAGVTVDHVSITDNQLPWELSRASVRHRIVRRFADRFIQAIGESEATAMFDWGWLYSKSGRTSLSYEGGSIFDHAQNIGIANVDAHGQIRGRSGEVQAFVIDGVIIDPQGSTLAMLEMASGFGCPDSFFPDVDVLIAQPARTYMTSIAGVRSGDLPVPNGVWSTQDLKTLLDSY